MKSSLKSVIALTVICAVLAVLLAVVNGVTAPIIAENEQGAANAALIEVLPDGGNFEELDITQYELPATVTNAYRAENGGYVVQLTTSGYGANMVIMCGVDANGTVTGAKCLSSSETLGYEKTYGENMKNQTIETIDSVDTIASATLTTSGYKNAVKDALNTAIILGGGSADIRTEEEILADNLKGALPAGDTFTEMFISEKLEGVSAVYSADNGAGFVYVTGEGENAIFVGVDTEGKVVSEASDDVKANIEAQAQIVLASSLEEIDITKYADMPKQVEKAYKTASGNYVLEIRASGFGINGDKYYNPSGEYIKIKIAVTADGEVINCVTTSQAETDGLGSVCGDKAFSSQFNGKTEETYKDIDGISGATITTNGYTSGVAKAFEAVKIMEGEA